MLCRSLSIKTEARMLSKTTPWIVSNQRHTKCGKQTIIVVFGGRCLQQCSVFLAQFVKGTWQGWLFQTSRRTFPHLLSGFNPPGVFSIFVSQRWRDQDPVEVGPSVAGLLVPSLEDGSMRLWLCVEFRRDSRRPLLYVLSQFCCWLSGLYSVAKQFWGRKNVMFCTTHKQWRGGWVRCWTLK